MAMAFTREEALAKIGKRVQMQDLVEEDGTGGMCFSDTVPAGTTGRVIHANLDFRLSHSAYEPHDFYEVVIEWDLPDREIDTFGERAYRWFLTELA
jgi:hypothetical protein